MGACFSCLGLGGNESDSNEQSSLLGNSHLYSNDDLHEDLIKQQQRQNELNAIVNDLSESLIDVSTFQSKNTGDDLRSNKNMVTSTQNTDIFATANGLRHSSSTQTQLSGERDINEPDKTYPYLWPLQKKAELMKEMSADPSTFEVQPSSEALYVVF